MPQPAVKPPTSTPGCLIDGLGVLVGAVVGLVVPLPLALFLRHWLHLPEINATPGDKDLTATYWLPWVLSWLGANLVGIVLVLWPRTRRASRWFLIASLVTSTMVSWFYFGLEYYGLGLN